MRSLRTYKGSRTRRVTTLDFFLAKKVSKKNTRFFFHSKSKKTRRWGISAFEAKLSMRLFKYFDTNGPLGA